MNNEENFPHPINRKKSPAIILADLGYDVFLANSRGTVYSLEHENLDIKSEEFWDFSFSDMKYDHLANLEYICGARGV